MSDDDDGEYECGWGCGLVVILVGVAFALWIAEDAIVHIIHAVQGR